MTAVFSTPDILILGIQDRLAAAQQALLDRVRPLLCELVESHRRRHPEVKQPQVLAKAFEPWVIIRIRYLSPNEIERFREIGEPPEKRDKPAPVEPDRAQRMWKVFDAYLLAAVKRVLLWEPAESTGETRREPLTMVGNESLPGAADVPIDAQITGVENSGYAVRVYYHPHDCVGGDWTFTAVDDENRLWTMVADTTGHSWPAYVIKQCALIVWKEFLVGQPQEPEELLRNLDDRIEAADCLPDGIFFEATVGRFSPQGHVALAASGAGYTVARRSGNGQSHFEVVKGGLYLGVGIPLPREHHERCLEVGDELMLATDGLAEQPTTEGMLGKQLNSLLNVSADQPALHDSVVAILTKVWQSHPRHDDTTLLTVKRMQ